MKPLDGAEVVKLQIDKVVGFRETVRLLTIIPYHPWRLLINLCRLHRFTELWFNKATSRIPQMNLLLRVRLQAVITRTLLRTIGRGLLMVVQAVQVRYFEHWQHGCFGYLLVIDVRRIQYLGGGSCGLFLALD